jgi:putative zinc finger/helix-turn-helix YgiT family protein
MPFATARGCISRSSFPRGRLERGVSISPRRSREMNQNIGEDMATKEVCLECGSARLEEQIKEQQFPYGTGEGRVSLSAKVPVFTCLDCGYEFFGERGESARHDAVCRYLCVQTPDEIRRVRETAGMSRAEFCQLAGFGLASLQRWESGSVVPNASIDRLIFLLRYAENLEHLRNRISAGLVAEPLDNETAIALRARIPEAHTRRGIKKFLRLAHEPRIAQQARGFNLLARVGY